MLIFGVVLLTFLGHTSAANSAKVVLERDPTGRAALAFTGALERSALEGTHYLGGIIARGGGLPAA